MSDGLAIPVELSGTAEVRRASSDCCGAKLDVGGDGETQFYLCRGCGKPCDRILGAPEVVTLHG